MNLNEVKKYSKEINAIFGEISTKMNFGIEELFKCIGNKYLEEIERTEKPKETDYPNKLLFINKLKKYLSL